jgi:glycosyltransferase
MNQHNMALGRDYEIICVNDGSTDDSARVLARFEGGGICVVHQQNAGVSAARNNGLEHARGEYIWFIDSDDFIRNDILESLWSFLRKTGSDGIRIEKVAVGADAHPQSAFMAVKLQESMDSRRASTAVDYIVSRDYLIRHKIRFDRSITYGEDTLWVFWLHFFKGVFRNLSNCFYFYRQRPGSAVHSTAKDRHVKHLKSMQAMLATYQRALNEYGDRLSEAERSHLKHRIYWSIQNVLFDALHAAPEERSHILNELTTTGFYPYPVLWGRLSLKYGWKNLAMNLISLFFPFKSYYLSICRCKDLLKK